MEKNEIIEVPFYRALSLETNKWIEGYLTSNPEKTVFKISGDSNGYSFIEKVDPKTLSIHFSTMIKSGKKLFASIRENGIGGDLFKYVRAGSNPDDRFVYIFSNNRFTLKLTKNSGTIERQPYEDNFEFVGIFV